MFLTGSRQVKLTVQVKETAKGPKQETQFSPHGLIRTIRCTSWQFSVGLGAALWADADDVAQVSGEIWGVNLPPTFGAGPTGKLQAKVELQAKAEGPHSGLMPMMPPKLVVKSGG